LPLVSTTPAAPVDKFVAGVVDADGGKIATGVVDIAVVHLDLRISTRIFEILKMTLKLFSGA
jgi:hypothetical protein